MDKTQFILGGTYPKPTAAQRKEIIDDLVNARYGRISCTYSEMAAFFTKWHRFGFADPDRRASFAYETYSTLFDGCYETWVAEMVDNVLNW